MRIELNKKGVALGLVVGVLGGAAGGALATSGGSKATTTTVPSATKQARVDAFLSDVAGRLGVDVAKLKTALKGAAIDQVDQAVKDGKLTQSQADAIIQRINSGNLGPGFGLGGRGFGRGGFGHMGFGHLDMLSAAATYLGLTQAELRSQLESGKSLADIAKTTAGRSVSGLQDAIVAAVTKDVNANTNLTADQKAQIIAQVKAHVADLVNGKPGAAPKFGRQRPMMGFGGPRAHWR